MCQPTKHQHSILVTDRYLISALSAKGIKIQRLYLDATDYCAHGAFPSNNRVRRYIREYQAGKLQVPAKAFVDYTQMLDAWEIDTQVEFSDSIKYTEDDKQQ